jgi:hypothetical protein
MRQTFEEVLRVPAINRYFADEVSGFGVAYPEPLFAPDGNWEHRDGVSGQRLPDRELVLQDGSRTTLYRLLENGRWVRLQLASDEAVISDAMTVVTLASGADAGILRLQHSGAAVECRLPRAAFVGLPKAFRTRNVD